VIDCDREMPATVQFHPAPHGAALIDPETVSLASACPLRWTMEDVDTDGDEDLLFHFKTQELSLDENSTEVTLEDLTYAGTDIWGTDTVNIVP